MMRGNIRKLKLKPTPTEKNNNTQYFDVENMLQKLIGDLLKEFIIPIENDAKKLPELQRTILAIKRKTKSILSPLSHLAAVDFAKLLESERKISLEIAINDLFYCDSQRKKEQVVSFASRVQYLANECLSLIALGDSDDQPEQIRHVRKMQYFIFISGLKSNVKRQVVGDMPEDFVDAVVAAMITERMKANRPKKPKPEEFKSPFRFTTCHKYPLAKLMVNLRV